MINEVWNQERSIDRLESQLLHKDVQIERSRATLDTYIQAMKEALKTTHERCKSAIETFGRSPTGE